MKLLTNEQQESFENAKICYNLKYSIPKEVTIIFHNGSNYNNHFIIKRVRRI